MIIPNNKKDLKTAVSKLETRKLPLGVDIGTTSIKIVELNLVNNKPKISKLILKELPQDIADNREQYLRIIPLVLSEIIEENKLKGHSAYTAISLDDCQIKNISLPKITYSEIKAAVKNNMLKDGVDLGNTLFDYMILNEDKIDTLNRIDLIAIEARKDDVTRRVSLLNSATLNTLVVESEPTSLLECLNYHGIIKDNEVVILLDFGGLLTQLNIVVNKELYFSRKLNINSRSLSNSISEYCKVSNQEADQLKIKYDPGIYIDYNILKSYVKNSQMPIKKDTVDIHHVNVRDAIYFSLEALVSSIKQTFNYFSYQLTNSQIKSFDRIVLFGGATNLKIISPYLKESLGVAVESAKPLGALDFSEGINLNVYNLDRDLFRFGVAMGLALRGLNNTNKKRINLISQEERKKNIITQIKKWFVKIRSLEKDNVDKIQDQDAAQKAQISANKIEYKFGSWSSARELDSTKALSEQLGIPFIDLPSYNIDISVVKLVPSYVAKKLKAMPVFRTGSSLTVAMANPLDVIAIDELARVSGLNIDPVFATSSGIESAISKYCDK